MGTPWRRKEWSIISLVNTLGILQKSNSTEGALQRPHPHPVISSSSYQKLRPQCESYQELGMYYGWYLSNWSKSENFDQSGIWTHDPEISRLELYQLSYLVMAFLPFAVGWFLPLLQRGRVSGSKSLHSHSSTATAVTCTLLGPSYYLVNT